MTVLMISVMVASAACSSMGGSGYGTRPLRTSDAASLGRFVGVAPSTLKVLQDHVPIVAMKRAIELHAARAEGESAQILVFSGTVPLESVSVESTELRGPDNRCIVPEIGLVGYVRVTKPTIVSFWKKGDYPKSLIWVHVVSFTF